VIDRTFNNKNVTLTLTDFDFDTERHIVDMNTTGYKGFHPNISDNPMPVIYFKEGIKIGFE
jgi:hypothetical protein